MPVGGQLIAVIYFGHGSVGLDENDRRVYERGEWGKPMMGLIYTGWKVTDAPMEDVADTR